MKTVNPEELVLALPVAEPKKMTKAQKLRRLAELVREHKGVFALASGLEHWTPQQMSEVAASRWGTSAFTVALADSVFQEQGLKAGPTPARYGSGATMADVTGFFELSQGELHEFSCDCGGAIPNDVMAARIENIADRA